MSLSNVTFVTIKEAEINFSFKIYFEWIKYIKISNKS